MAPFGGTGGKGRGRPKKDPFEDLDDDEKNKFAGMSRDEIKLAMAKVAMDEQDNQSAKEEDQDLKEKQELAKEAGEQYRQSSKLNKLRQNFLRRCLEDKGGA